MGYKVKLSKNGLSAELEFENDDINVSYSVDDLIDVLNKNKVVFGIKIDVLKLISADPFSIEYPVTVAQGVQKKDGKDSYLQNELQTSSRSDEKVYNFREVLSIPSVQKGQLLAIIVPAKNGRPGTSVTGNPIPAKPGRPLRIRAGNNVIYESGKFYAACDGQVSITKKAISVNPVFEVKGDLDLKVGNIDFVGNIVIKGNVPTGYELNAGGDIWVDGMVEGARIHAEGNIVIKGGVAGAMKGSITAGGNVQANYLNQANVIAGQDVLVKSSILHSKLTAGGNIDCKTGTIIGGMISAGRNIFVKDLGNELFTKSELAIGWDPLLEKTELDTIASIENAKMNIKKLTEIEAKLNEIGKVTGKLTTEQKQMIGKQRATRESMERNMSVNLDELNLIQAEKQDRLNSSLFVSERVYPNTKVYFGKYAIITNQFYKNVSFFLENSEISIQPIANPNPGILEVTR